MSDNFFIKLKITTEQAMQAFGAKLAVACEKKAAVIFLYGQLGAGKTTFARGFLHEMGHKGHVKSPTYTLVEPYQLSDIVLYHFDFYRLRDPLELEYIGIEEYFSAQSICLVEWPDYGAGLLPVPDLDCYIEVHAQVREIKLIPHTKRGNHILEHFEFDK